MDSVSSESELARSFREFLVSDLRYPREALLENFVLGWPAGGKTIQPDLVVVDTATSEPLAVFEFRVGPADAAKVTKLLELAAAAAGARNPVPAYLITPGPSYAGFHVQGLVLSRTLPGRAPIAEPLTLGDLPTYSRLLLGAGKRNREAQRTAVDRFQLGCYILAFLVAGLLGASFVPSWKINPSPVQLGLVIAILALFILPSAAKLKAFGFEFERRATHQTRLSPGPEPGDTKPRRTTG